MSFYTHFISDNIQTRVLRERNNNINKYEFKINSTLVLEVTANEGHILIYIMISCQWRV